MRTVLILIALASTSCRAAITTIKVTETVFVTVTAPSNSTTWDLFPSLASSTPASAAVSSSMSQPSLSSSQSNLPSSSSSTSSASATPSATSTAPKPQNTGDPAFKCGGQIYGWCPDPESVCSLHDRMGPMPANEERRLFGKYAKVSNFNLPGWVAPGDRDLYTPPQYAYSCRKYGKECGKNFGWCPGSEVCYRKSNSTSGFYCGNPQPFKCGSGIGNEKNAYGIGCAANEICHPIVAPGKSASSEERRLLEHPSSMIKRGLFQCGVNDCRTTGCYGVQTRGNSRPVVQKAYEYCYVNELVPDVRCVFGPFTDTYIGWI